MSRVIFRPWLLLLGGLAACKPDAGLTKYNSEPEAQITAPGDGETVLEGTVVTLRGAASDANHDASELITRWFVGDTEACASTVPAADGTTTCDVTVLASDALSVRLEVVDADGAAGTASATYAVTPNEAPTAEIQSPSSDGVYYSDQLITLRGAVDDMEDEPAALVVRWQSSVDGDLGTVTPNSEGLLESFVTLSEGTHAVQLFVTDTAGNEGQASVLIDVGPPNTAPDCAITEPSDGGASASGERVDFVALASDVDIASNLLSVTWESDKDGALGSSTPDGTGAIVFSTSALSVDTHRVTMTVSDELGATCARALTWTVGTPPVIDMESPVSGDVVNEGDSVTFSALVSDGEDMPADLWVTWESSLDGLLYEGPPDSTGLAEFLDGALSTGDHALTATVTDSAGLYAAARATFTVNGVPSPPGVTIAPSSPYTDDDLRVTIASASVDPEGDAISYAYAWSVDGVPSSASTSSTLPASATEAGQAWTVSVTASDGLATSAAGTASVTIVNTDPVVTASLTPASATRASTLTCTGTATDVDADTPTLTFGWTVDGAPVTASSSTSSLSTLVGAFAVGQLVACTVTADDGKGGTDSDSASVTIGNTAPVVDGVTLSPGTVYTNDTLTAVASASDADGDALTLTYDWYVDGTLVQSGPSDTLDGAAYFDRDEVVYVEVLAEDGADSASATSASTTVSNTAPSAPVVEITPSDAASGDDLTCAVVTPSADADGDALTYAFAWDVDGVAHEDATDASTSSLVDGSTVGWNETWTCAVVASDGSAMSGAASDSVSTECMLGSESGCAASSCVEILASGASTGDGVYYVDPDGSGAVAVYCDMTSDGGGWLLVYVNANNWGSTTAHTITLAPSASPSYQWFDATWGVTAVRSASRLGTTWDGAYPLEPDEMGAINVKTWYALGFQSVRYEFERGSDGARHAGWCDTSAAPWDWTSGMTGRYTCKRSSPDGSGHHVSMSGVDDVCDGSLWNTGWTMDVALGDADWDYAYQASPNHLTFTDGQRLMFMVAGFDQTYHANNAADQDYLMRVWLREP
jgi:hypothetical protein